MKKRWLSLALALCMALSLLPLGAAAADVIDSGKCGENLTWTLDSEGLLTISGSGEMDQYDWTSPPWYKDYSSDIKTVVKKNGVTSIADYAFSGCSSLTSVTIPESVTEIGWNAFRDCAALFWYTGSSLRTAAAG